MSSTQDYDRTTAAEDATGNNEGLWEMPFHGFFVRLVAYVAGRKESTAADARAALARHVLYVRQTDLSQISYVTELPLNKYIRELKALREDVRLAKKEKARADDAAFNARAQLNNARSAYFNFGLMRLEEYERAILAGGWEPKNGKFKKMDAKFNIERKVTPILLTQSTTNLLAVSKVLPGHAYDVVRSTHAYAAKKRALVRQARLEISQAVSRLNGPMARAAVKKWMKAMRDLDAAEASLRTAGQRGVQAAEDFAWFN